MGTSSLLDVVAESLTTVVLVAAPPLLMGLTVGLLISIFQSITSIQEQTLAFVPKILAVFMSLLIFGTFMFSRLERFAVELIETIPDYIANLY